MDITTGLHSHLHRFFSEPGFDGDTVEESLITLTTNLETAVPSFLGLQLRIVEQGQPVVVTAASPDGTARTSLRLPLLILCPSFESGSRLTFYAGTPGAFVDLAADLSFSLHLPAFAGRDCPGDGGRRIILDADLPPTALISGVSGWEDLSTINRAIGLLIGRGHHPDHAGDALHREAEQRGLEVSAYAAWLLSRSMGQPRAVCASGGPSR